MSKISVTTIAGLTSGGDANKVKIESGDDLVVESGGIGIGTSTISTAVGGGIEVHRANGSSFRIEDTTNSVTGELQVYSSGVNLVAQTNHPIIVSPNNAETARFTTDGLKMASGKGIDFSANSNASGMTSELLDDYEEGTWTPNVGGNATYNYQYGIYTKIGRHVFIRGDISVNALGTGSANTLSGLPFSGNYQNTPQGAVNVMYFSNVAQNFTWMSGYINNNATTIYFSGSVSGAVTIQVNGGNVFGNNARILFSASYTAD